MKGGGEGDCRGGEMSQPCKGRISFKLPHLEKGFELPEEGGDESKDEIFVKIMNVFEKRISKESFTRVEI